MANYVATDAFVEYLHENGIGGNPLIDLRILDSEIENEITERFSEEYDRAADGEATVDPFASMLTPMANGEEPQITKGDVLQAWADEVRKAFPRAYMMEYTREEAVTMLNLLNRKHLDTYLSIQIIPGYSYTIFDLMRGWNEIHPGENPVTFTGYDLMP